jgi:hypothetical protein
MQKQLSQEELGEIATALNTLARYGLLYGGFRRKQRKVVEVRATKHIVVKYEDGDLRYLDPATGKTYHFYVHIPPPER